MKLKIKNHQYSEKSKFGRHREPDAEILHVGDFVYLKEDGDKHKLKDLYLVVVLGSSSVIWVLSASCVFWCIFDQGIFLGK